MASKIELAYTAGIIDGEGSIAIYNMSMPPHTGKRTHALRVRVGMCDMGIPHWLQLRFGGSVSKSKPKNPRHLMVYTWTLSTKAAGGFLQSILPYLKLKQEQAELAIEFQIGKVGKGKNKPLDILLRETNLAKRLQALHIGGK